MVENFGRKPGEFHDVVAVVGAGSDRLENLGLLTAVANKAFCAEMLLFFGVIFGEQDAQNVVWFGVRSGALRDKFIAPLRVRAGDVAGDSKNLLALI